jgi:hypothetical protein
VIFARHGALSSAVRLSIRRHRSGSRSRHGSQVRRIHRGQRVPRLWQVFGKLRWELVGIEAAYLAQRERMNPRFLPTSSRWFLSVQACHAGGRGFESRRSRRKHPAYRHLLLPVLAQADRPVSDRSRAHPRTRIRTRSGQRKALQIAMFCGWTRSQGPRSSRSDPASESPGGARRGRWGLRMA